MQGFRPLLLIPYDRDWETILLQHWVLQQCKDINPEVWKHIRPGMFIMHIANLHLFINDYYMLFGAKSDG